LQLSHSGVLDRLLNIFKVFLNNLSLNKKYSPPK
jgi:hypothetical protein